MIDLVFPADLRGQTVLDLGGYTGAHARRCLDLDAASATVVDNAEWRQYLDWPTPTPLPGVRYVDGDLHDWREPADLVICSNVLYHVKEPLRCLAHLRTLTRGLLLLRTSFVPDAEGDAQGWRWYGDGRGHPNGTVWCRPTLTGLTAALHGAGFADVREQSRLGDHVTVEAR